MLAHLENSAVATGLEKVSFHPNPKERQSKECSNYRTSALFPHANKVMLKIFQARLQQYVNRELPDIQQNLPVKPFVPRVIFVGEFLTIIKFFLTGQRSFQFICFILSRFLYCLSRNLSISIKWLDLQHRVVSKFFLFV